MNGAVVENLSNRKLSYILAAAFLAQVIFFLVGGLIAPQPSTSMMNGMRICRDITLGTSKKWFYVRPTKGCSEEIFDLDEKTILYTQDTRELVFVAQMPNPKENVELQFSPWFQHMLGVLEMQIEHSTKIPAWKMGRNPELRLEIRMGYRNVNDAVDQWHELISTTVTRKLHCSLDAAHATDGSLYDCQALDLFELGSVDYPFYLLNIRIPSMENSTYNHEIGHLKDLTVIEIHQNGGFTKVWLSIKFCLLPFMLFAVLWYKKRVDLLSRKPYLLEKAIFNLGLAMLFINTPLEVLSLWIRMPFMLLLTDIRQGVFYALLLSFWYIFCGEHLLDEGRKNELSHYWKHLTAVLFGCICLFVFDMCERGVHLTNPFYSIWSTSLGTNLAYIFIYLSLISAAVYFIFLAYWIARVVLTIKRRRPSLAAMKEGRRVKFEGIIYRFKFVMIFTAVCACLTIVAFGMTRFGEGQLRWGDYDDSPLMNYSGSFLTGVYGMWNIYTILLLVLYAPSHKKYPQARPGTDDDDLDLDNDSPATESSALTTFLKPCAD